MESKKTKYFSYLEDTKKHHVKIARIAANGVKKAVESAIKNKEKPYGIR